MRLAGTVMGRRLLVAVALAVTAVATVGWLYDSADSPKAMAAGPAGLSSAQRPRPARPRSRRPPSRATPRRSGPRRPTRPGGRRLVGGPPEGRRRQGPGPGTAEVSGTEVQVLVMAEAGGARMPSRYVTVRKGADGWKVP